MSFGSGFVAGAGAGNARRRTDIYEEGRTNTVSAPQMPRANPSPRQQQSQPQGRGMLQDSQTNDGGGPSTPEVDPDLQRMQTDYKDAIVGIGMADFSGATDYINRYGNPNVQVSRIKQNEDGTISMWRGNP